MCLAACCRRQPRASSPHVHGRSRGISFHCGTAETVPITVRVGPEGQHLGAWRRQAAVSASSTHPLFGLSLSRSRFGERVRLAPLACSPGHDNVAVRNRHYPMASGPSGAQAGAKTQNCKARLISARLRRPRGRPSTPGSPASSTSHVSSCGRGPPDVSRLRPASKPPSQSPSSAIPELLLCFSLRSRFGQRVRFRLLTKRQETSVTPLESGVPSVVPRSLEESSERRDAQQRAAPTQNSAAFDRRHSKARNGPAVCSPPLCRSLERCAKPGWLRRQFVALPLRPNGLPGAR